MKVESPLRLDGWIVKFEKAGTWFYTPDEPPENYEEMQTSFEFGRKSTNFPSKTSAEAFGLGFEKEVVRQL